MTTNYAELRELAKRGCHTPKNDVIGLLDTIDALTAELDKCAQLLPGPRYMDLPDGGSVSISEQLSRMFAELKQKLSKATRSLELAGYTDEGGELWKPSIGRNVSPLIDRIDELQHQLTAAQKQNELNKQFVTIYFSALQDIETCTDKGAGWCNGRATEAIADAIEAEEAAQNLETN